MRCGSAIFIPSTIRPPKWLGRYLTQGFRAFNVYISKVPDESCQSVSGSVTAHVGLAAGPLLVAAFSPARAGHGSGKGMIPSSLTFPCS